jgi:hypothetical protein
MEQEDAVLRDIPVTIGLVEEAVERHRLSVLDLDVAVVESTADISSTSHPGSLGCSVAVLSEPVVSNELGGLAFVVGSALTGVDHQ